MERRKFLATLVGCTTALTLCQLESLLAATGFHEKGPYNGPLLTSYISTTCGACEGGCGMKVRTVDGIPVGVEGNPLHPVSRGGLCPVGVASLGLLIHPDRVKQPMLRSGPRGSGEYRPISWEEAERLIVEKLSELQRAGTQEQLLFLDSRESGPGLELARKFAADFGTPNFYHNIDPSRSVAASVWGGEDTAFGYDLENSKLVFCFGLPAFEGGRNPVYLANLRSRSMEKTENHNGGFIVFDSRLSASAAKAERWIPVKAGTQGLLALGLIYIIIKEQLYDQDTVNRHCVGFDDETDRDGNAIEGFKNLVLRQYYPAFVSKNTGVALDQIIALARLFATTPKAIAVTGRGVTDTVDGIYQDWAVMALNVLTGKAGKSGGVISFEDVPLQYPTPKEINTTPLVSPSENRFPYLRGKGAIELLPESILAGTPYPVGVAIMNNVNPVYDSPRENRFRQALQNIPFTVAITCLQNETSLLADLVLPDCTFLEKTDIVLPSSELSHPVAGLTQPVVSPLYDSRQSDDVLVSLGRTLLGGDWKTWSHYGVFIEERINDLFQSNSGTLFSDQFTVSFESLLAARGWRRKEYRDVADFQRQLEETGGWWNPGESRESEGLRFPSSSGKFFLVSGPLESRFADNPEQLTAILSGAGLNPNGVRSHMLASHRDFKDTHESATPLSLYLIELTTLRGEGARLDKMAEMVGYSDNIKWKSWVELNPETAEELHLANNQQVWVESPRGRKKMVLVINPGLVPGIAAVPSGVGRSGTFQFGENVTEIISVDQDCLTGAVARAETHVRVYAAA